MFRRRFGGLVINMVLKMHSRLFHGDTKKCVLMALTVMTILVTVQLLLSYSSFHSGATSISVQANGQSFKERSSNSGLERNLLDHKTQNSNPVGVPDVIPEYSDSKYKAVNDYHQRGLTLRRRFNCMRLFESDASEQEKVMKYLNASQNTFNVTADEEALDVVEDCDAFKRVRGYRMDRGTFDERELPIAYIIVVHKDFEHLERLLRMIYMPQHSICIHVDTKASDVMKRAVDKLAGCFDNVILASQPQDVVYAHVSRLMADVVCMKDLLAKDKSWRYLINYAATEFPLRSNYELAKILQVLHGLNDIHEQYQRRVEDRFNREHVVVNGRMKHTRIPLPPPPYNLTILKGQAYNTFSRKFLEWAFTDKKPVEFLNWCNKTYSPDEHYWATLNNLYHNPFLNAPGGFKGHPDRKGYITRFISWQYEKPSHKCQGKVIRHICTFSALDLPIFPFDMHLAANKFDLIFDPVAYSCMEELMENKTRTPSPFDLKFYKNQYFVNYAAPKR